MGENMWGHRIKIRKTDKLFSEYIREKAHWKCQRCGRDFNNNHIGLEASHYHGRRKESVRFDSDNVYAICKGCHWKFHEDKELHKKFVIEMIGKERFDILTVRENQFVKKDDKLQMLILEEKLRAIRAQIP
jgi:hypothetical protein